MCRQLKCLLPLLLTHGHLNKGDLVMFRARDAEHGDITDNNDVLVTYHYSVLIAFRFRVFLLYAGRLSLISH